MGPYAYKHEKIQTFHDKGLDNDIIIVTIIVTKTTTQFVLTMFQALCLMFYVHFFIQSSQELYEVQC